MFCRSRYCVTLFVNYAKEQCKSSVAWNRPTLWRLLYLPILSLCDVPQCISTVITLHLRFFSQCADTFDCMIGGHSLKPKLQNALLPWFCIFNLDKLVLLFLIDTSLYSVMHDVRVIIVNYILYSVMHDVRVIIVNYILYSVMHDVRVIIVNYISFSMCCSV